MAYFSDLNDNLNFVVSKILDNQDLCKYLYYPSKDPLSEPDILNPRQSLMMKNIFPLPKDANSVVDEISILNIYFPIVSPYKPNSGFREVILNFDVMCHLDIWDTDYGIRIYSIANEIDKMFNNNFYGEISIKRIFYKGASLKRFSDRFYGWQMIYELSNDSNVGKCNG